MVRKHSAARKDVVGRKHENETPPVALGDEELVTVAGGFLFLTNAFSNTMKTIGEGLSTVARKA